MTATSDAPCVPMIPIADLERVVISCSAAWSTRRASDPSAELLARNARQTIGHVRAALARGAFPPAPFARCTVTNLLEMLELALEGRQ